MKKTTLFLISLAILSCKDEEYDNIGDFARLQLPDSTETGQQTFACLVNGNVWTVFGKTQDRSFTSIGEAPWDDNKIQASVEETSINIAGTLTVVDDGEQILRQHLFIKFQLQDPAVATYSIGNDIGSSVTFTDNGMDFTRYKSSEKNPLTLLLKRYDSGIVSGTFRGFLFNNQDPFDSIQISHGIFDVKYNQ